MYSCMCGQKSNSYIWLSFKKIFYQLKLLKFFSHLILLVFHLWFKYANTLIFRCVCPVLPFFATSWIHWKNCGIFPSSARIQSVLPSIIGEGKSQWLHSCIWKFLGQWRWTFWRTWGPGMEVLGGEETNYPRHFMHFRSVLVYLDHWL